jgi:hypothetical protein
MKLHQNRIVIVGRNYQDAYAFGQTDRFKDELEAPVLVTSASHRLHILGSLAGMHVGTAYVTSDAPEGENYEIVEEALTRLRTVNPDMLVMLEPRKVHA